MHRYSNQSMTPSHTSSFVDVALEKPTFPDAQHDNFVKSVSSGSRSDTKSSNGGSNPMLKSATSRRVGSTQSRQNCDEQLVHHSNHFRAENNSHTTSESIQNHSLPMEYSIKSEYPHSSPYLYSPSPTFTESEPIHYSYPKKQSFNRRQYCNGINAPDLISRYPFMEKQENHQYAPDGHGTHRHYSSHPGGFSEPNKSRKNVTNFRDTKSLQFPRKIYVTDNKQNNTKTIHHNDDNSTIPSEEQMDCHSLKVSEAPSVPSHIQYNEKDKRHHYSIPSRSTTSPSINLSSRYTVEKKPYSNDCNQETNILNVQQSSNNMSVCRSKCNDDRFAVLKSQYLEQQPPFERYSNTFHNRPGSLSDSSSSYSTLDINVPNMEAMQSTHVTDSTTDCTTLGSNTLPGSDKYRHNSYSKQSMSTITSDINRSEPPTPITHVESSQTPIRSNTAFEFVGETNLPTMKQSRLDILQEIGMSMEMKQKAKLSQEEEDYNFWVKHIDKLNRELDSFKFLHLKDDTKKIVKVSKGNIDDPKLTHKQINVDDKPILKSRRPNFQSSQDNTGKPVSILKKVKQREKRIKIRSPVDFDEGHVFTVKVKGENIQASIVSALKLFQQKTASFSISHLIFCFL